MNATIIDRPRATSEAATTVKNTVKQSLVGSITTGIINLLSFAADRAAYDAAVLVASGGNGETPLFDKRTVSQYFSEVGASVAGEAVGLLSENIQGAGGILSNFNLCAPSSPQILLALKFSIKSAFERPEPLCDINAVVQNWNGFLASFSQSQDATTTNQAILAALASSYDPNVNEFSVGLQLYGNIIGASIEQANLSTQKNIATNGFQDVTNFITGQVATPASMVQQDLVSSQDRAKSIPYQTMASLMANSDALLQIGVHAGSVFTNTLLSSLTQKLYDGFFTFSQVTPDPFDSSALTLTNSDAARNAYSSFLTAAPLQVSNYSILGDFSSCPATGRGLYNCVADSNFISAVARASSGAPETIAEAINDGLINGGWPLIPSADHARDQDPYCYTYGFCHGNLVKMRKARVISIGWEMAADSAYNSADNPVTLQEVLSGFSSCNDLGQPDSTHPWCKLIDPTWVLEYPITECQKQVYGQLLQSGESDQRQAECVDMPSCIAEDGNGNCVGGYGYCVREENIWRFRGDSCPEQYASCITVDNGTTTASYLRNTTDSSVCDVDNAGCLLYETQKTKNTDGSFSWPAVSDIATANASADAYKSRLYFNANVEACDSAAGGCHEVIERSSDLSLNLLQNSSFETGPDSGKLPDAWLFSGSSGATVSADGSLSRSGNAALKAGTSYVYEPGIAFTQGRFYTMSFYARQEADGDKNTGKMLIAFSSDDGSAIDLSGTSMSAGCTLADGNGDGKMDIVSLTGTPAGTTYERFTCTFTSPLTVDAAANITAFVDIAPGSVYVDDVQVEQGETVSAYHDGYSTTDYVTKVVKVPPSYLGCTGESTDPADCANYAAVCGENDVGCTEYTPSNGDPAVTGVVSELDYCPTECVGYDAYKQEATAYEPDGAFPVYFIPESGKTCSAVDVGCDEFTDLSTEAKAYFTSLRACVTTTQAAANTHLDNEATFYTWEGSDTSGYQLKTWHLLESNMGVTAYTYAFSGGEEANPGAAPCVNWITTASGIECNDASLDKAKVAKYDWDTAVCDEHSDLLSNPDCREFYDVDGKIHYREWSKTVTVNDACVTYRKSTIVGADATKQTANCTNSGGYYDAATATCRYYGYSAESNTCSAAANGCRDYTGGTSRDSRIAFEDTVESGNLNNWDAASASTLTLSNESLATDGHSLDAKAAFSTFVFNNGSVCTDTAGCAGKATAEGGTCTVADGSQYCGTLENELFAGKTYTVSFWAKGTGMLAVGFDTKAKNGKPVIDVSFGSVTLTTDWQEYSFGPLDMTSTTYPDFGSGTTLAFVPSGESFVDNLVLREGQENITLIKDSWVTPASCDQSPDGGSSPKYYLGCQEYTDQVGNVVDLKSFSRLCDGSKVGCQDFYLTEESASPYAAVYGAACSTLDGSTVTAATSCYYLSSSGSYDTTSPLLCTIGVGLSSCTFNMNWFVDTASLPDHISYVASTAVVPADQDIALVVNDDVTCVSGTEGCTEVGLPTWGQDHDSITGATSTYLMNTPEQYSDILCNQDALFCAAWSGTDGTKYYFKDPGDQTCEYRTSVTVDGTAYDGWFRTGTDNFCYGTCSGGTNSGSSCASSADCQDGGTCDATDPSYVVNGNLSSIWKNGDASYGGWAGACDAQYDSCSEFEDKLDVGAGNVYGIGRSASYFFLNNNNLADNTLPSSEQCNGQVSLKQGCALFNDTGTAGLTSNASATEIASRHADRLFNSAQFALVDPLDCSVADSSIELSDGSASVDLCALRCVYDHGKVNDVTDGVSAKKKLKSGGTETAAELYVYGTSCYDVTDCAPLISEAGDSVNASGCDTSVSTLVSGVLLSETVTRLTNDSNVVIKVNRDRQCSEWLSCADSQSVWDDNTNSYKSICGDVELCTQYSSVGNSSFCSEWRFDDASVVLDQNKYTSRDVSWYGDDYSGFAIPNLFPVQTLSQANVAPPANACDLRAALDAGKITSDEFDKHQGDSCTQDSDCKGKVNNSCVLTDTQDYRLVLDAGTCTEGHGVDCLVGVCSKTGAACHDDASCGTGGGKCEVGTCYAISTTHCVSDDGCSADQICNGGFCATEDATVNIADYKSKNPNNSCNKSSDIFSPFTGFKTGSCMRGQCLLAPDGSKFESGTTDSQVCRAYPEVNSPFAYTLATEWRNATDGLAITDPTSRNLSWADAPYSALSGFANAQLCAPGEVCDCSYSKVTFGDSAATKYISRDSSSSGYEAIVKHDRGICAGGSQVGKACDDGGCADGGTCEKSTRIDTMLGITGYCLERDSAININGDRNQEACLTWLPVDQLAGSTDLYAKYTSAGWDGDLFYCANVNGYINAKTMLGCSEIFINGTGNAATSTTDANKSDCQYTINCPVGYWAVGGSAKNSSSETNGYADQCTDNVHACPYLCIPNASVHKDSGEECNPPGTGTGTDASMTFITKGNALYGNKTYYYFDSDYVNAESLIKNYQDCTNYGLAIDESGNDALGLLNFKMDGDTFGNVDEDYYMATKTGNMFDAPVGTAGEEAFLGKPFEGYPACSTLLQAADSDTENYNAVWTDRLLNSDSDLSRIGVGSRKYSYNTDQSPWAHSISANDVNDGLNSLWSDPLPAVLPACIDEKTDSFWDPSTVKLSSDPTNPTSCIDHGADYLPAFGNDGDTQAQTFLDWTSMDDNGKNVTTTEDNSSIASRLSKLFAAPVKLWSWKDGNSVLTDSVVPTANSGLLGLYDDGTDLTSGPNWDVRSTGNPPTVWAINADKCTDTECEEGETNSITVNDQNSGDQSATGFFRAYVKFYAAADKNQLPLRRVLVDWGDGNTTGATDDQNFYKNHRGLQTGTTNPFCDPAATEWGLTDASCDSNYFSYNHIYQCSSTLLRSTDPADKCATDANGHLKTSPCVTNQGTKLASCSFEPRVQVRDNWGWCSGTCNNNEGCFDGDGGLVSQTTGNSSASSADHTGVDECASVWPELTDTDPTEKTGIDPWVYYGGVITVTP